MDSYCTEYPEEEGGEFLYSFFHEFGFIIHWDESLIALVLPVESLILLKTFAKFVFTQFIIGFTSKMGSSGNTLAKLDSVFTDTALILR